MASTLTCLLVHIVFSTKRREPIIDESLDKELHTYLGSTCRGEKCPALCIGGAGDHVHLLVSLHKTVALATLLQRIKQASSRWAKDKGVRGFSWQDGYGGFSIGRSQVPALRAYIARQRQHHRRVSFQDEIRRLCRLYEVEFDERYIWG